MIYDYIRAISKHLRRKNKKKTTMRVSSIIRQYHSTNTIWIRKRINGSNRNQLTKEVRPTLDASDEVLYATNNVRLWKSMHQSRRRLVCLYDHFGWFCWTLYPSSRFSSLHTKHLKVTNRWIETEIERKRI